MAAFTRGLASLALRTQAARSDCSTHEISEPYFSYDILAALWQPRCLASGPACNAFRPFHERRTRNCLGCWSRTPAGDRRNDHARRMCLSRSNAGKIRAPHLGERRRQVDLTCEQITATRNWAMKAMDQYKGQSPAVPTRSARSALFPGLPQTADASALPGPASGATVWHAARE